MLPLRRKEAYYSQLLTNPQYAGDMRMYSISSWVYSEYKKLAGIINKKWLNFQKKIFFPTVVAELSNHIGSYIITIFLVSQVVFNNLPVAVFLPGKRALYFFTMKIKSILESFRGIGECVIDTRDYRNFMETENEIAKEDVGILVTTISNQKELYCFENVSFKYPTTLSPVLSCLNFSIQMQDFHVVVGTNGAGKSTLMVLLCRLYDVDTGSILYNGVNIKEINYRSYRDQIGIAFQNYQQYNLSIAENVAMNLYEETEEMRTNIYEMLVKVGLKNKIDSLPNGIDTQLGRDFDEEGIFLSGGELQKLALARVLFMDTPVVILDEPSSALDPLAEEELISLALTVLKNKTVFYVSHRLSVAKYAHKVIFVNNNTVEAVMPHTELLKVNEKYNELYTAQAKHYTGDGSDENE